MVDNSRSKILIISNEFDPHVDYMIQILQNLSVEVIRWPTNHFPMNSDLSLRFEEQQTQGIIRIGHKHVDLNDIRSVWYRHPAPFVFPPDLSASEKQFAEEQVRHTFSGLLQTLDSFWVNHPEKVRIASSKPLQLKVAQEIGFDIPRTLVSNSPDDIKQFARDSGGGIVYKAFGTGFFPMTSKKFLTAPVSAEHLDKLHLIKNSPGIFQEHIPKKIDLRITVIGTRVYATEIHSQDYSHSRYDWRAADVELLRHCPHSLPRSIEDQCHKLLDRFGLGFGAIDMILTPDERYVFLENNPSGQFGWIEGLTGQPLTATLATMLIAGRVL